MMRSAGAKLESWPASVPDKEVGPPSSACGRMGRVEQGAHAQESLRCMAHLGISQLRNRWAEVSDGRGDY